MSAQVELGLGGRDMKHDPLIVIGRYFRGLSHQYLEQRRREGKPVDSSHSESHLNADADLIPVIGAAYEFSDREVLLGRFAAQFHDIVRSGREDLGLQDEIDSAATSVAVLVDIDQKGIFHTNQEEREAMEYAVLNHGKPPAFFEDPSTREDTPESLKDRLHAVLYVADALQKLGAPLINRRSAFVGGKRLTEGDLKDVVIEGKRIDPIDAVLLESAVRLGWKNVEDLYPRKLHRHIQPAFAIQRQWVSALLVSRGLDMTGWASLLWNARNGKGQNIFEFTSDTASSPPSSIEAIVEVLTNRGKMIDQGITEAASDPDLVLSSVEAVEYFSAHYKEPDPENTIKNWLPEGQRARIWKKGM